MTPNRQNPAYAILVCHRHPAAHQVRRRRHQRQRLSIKSMVLVFSRLRIKIGSQYKHCTGGCGPQILSAFVKQRTYRRENQQRMNRTSFHGTLW